ncbi:MAG: dihydrodipicolinate reductase, partial [Candidatus Rokuibacteriota bacterium]
GINPGYLMDTLPTILTAPCLRVDSVQVTRMMNSAKRRIPFQEKVGTGLTPSQFQDKIKSGAITGHVGLQESIHMIAAGLDWTLDEVTELPPEAILAERDVQTAVAVVKPGNVIGLKSVAFGKRAGKKAILMDFIAHAAVAEEYDEVAIKGEPDIRQRILGGVHGDVGTVAMTINTLPRAIAAAPGLKTMIDLAVPRAVP